MEQNNLFLIFNFYLNLNNHEKNTCNGIVFSFL
jgi:hypothetical protein